MSARASFVALFAALFVALAATSASADDCRPRDEQGRTLVACFDPGNRLYATVTTAGFGLGAVVRHTLGKIDRDVSYRLEHMLPTVTLGFSRFSAGLYELRLVRHATSGHLVFGSNPPRQIALPFDVGLYARLGRMELPHGSPLLDASLVTLAPTADFARSADHRFRLAIGPLARWDATFDRSSRAVTEHFIAPFTMGVLSAYAESRDGLSAARLDVEGGAISSSESGFAPRLRAEASVERVVVAVNDQPISLYAAGRFDAPGPRVLGEVGMRIAFLSGTRK